MQQGPATVVVNGALGEGILVPGHEFTGTVTAAGPAVTAFAPGDRVAAGTIVDSCGACAMCAAANSTTPNGGSG